MEAPEAVENGAWWWVGDGELESRPDLLFYGGEAGWELERGKVRFNCFLCEDIYCFISLNATVTRTPVKVDCCGGEAMVELEEFIKEELAEMLAWRREEGSSHCSNASLVVDEEEDVDSSGRSKDSRQLCRKG